MFIVCFINALKRPSYYLKNILFQFQICYHSHLTVSQKTKTNIKCRGQTWHSPCKVLGQGFFDTIPMTNVHVSVRAGFRTPDTSKVEIFVETGNAFHLLTFVLKSTVLVVEKILYPPLLSVLMPSSIFRHKRPNLRK